MNFKKLSFAFAVLSFFSISVFSRSRTDLRSYPQVSLVIKGNCKNSVHMYRCEGGFKVAPTLLNKWKKTSQTEDYYEYDDKTKFVTLDERIKLINEFLEQSCPSKSYGLWENFDIRHCPDEAQKQQIIFSVKWPNQDEPKREEYTLICDAQGGTAWLKLVYPKAQWQEVNNFPHYYEYQAKSAEEAKELDKFIGVMYEPTKEIPTGCRYKDCPLHKDAFEFCK